MDPVTIVSGVVLEKEDKILLVQEKKKHCYGQWNLPTGKLDFDQNIISNSVKEAKEETGYDVEIIDLIGVYNYVSPRPQNITRFQFRCKILGGKETFPTEELLTIKWFTKEEISNLPDSKLRSASAIRKILKDYYNNLSYPLKIINK